MTRLASLFSPNSVRGQLLAWLLGPLLLIGAFAIYDSYRTARITADSVSDRVLSGSALAIAERVFVNEDNRLEVDIPYVALQMLTSSEDDRVFYRIETEDGTFVTGYRDLNLPESESGQVGILFSNRIFREAPIRLATLSSATSSSTRSFGFRVGIAETTNARSAIAQSILLRSLARQAALIMGVAVLVWFAVARALRPLRRLERAVGRRSPEDVRPIKHRVPNEVQGLVSTINDLVDRFAASIKALENFTSNASHQFRTPLALIKTHLELAVREKKATDRKQAIEKAHTAVGEAERLMSQMLMLARVNTASAAEACSKTCDLSEVAREVCEDFVLQLSHTGKPEVDLGLHANGPVEVYAEKTLAQEIVRNLVDNAIKHSGRTPKIDVLVEKKGADGLLSVRDQGEGFDPEMIQAAGSDAEITNRLTQNGAGRGLPIVREIISMLGGRLSAKRLSDPSGMSVNASFRLAG